jgi:hypothetical protein
VFNQIMQISLGMGFQVTRPLILLTIMLNWILLPAAACQPPGLPVARPGDGNRGALRIGEQEQLLEPGKPIERELSPGRPHFYTRI